MSSRAPRSLAGKVIAITGGGRGIGRATATALTAQGARVAIGDIDAELAAATAAQLGAGTLGLALDVTDTASFTAFLDEVERELGPLDVLVNNAGIMPLGPFVAEPETTARRLVDINLHGVIIGSKLALERFLPRGRGHLVNIASMAGKGGYPGGATYCATKHAVVGLSHTIRAEVHGAGIDVSTVMPTVVNTELGSGLPPTRGFRFAEPEEVAESIVEALRTGRMNVYVPRSMRWVALGGALAPPRVADFVNRIFKADQVLARPDHLARAAYDARMAAGEENGAPAPAPAAEPAREPAGT